MAKQDSTIYGLHLEVDKELSAKDQERLNNIFQHAADSIAKLNLKQTPKVNFPVKPSHDKNR